MADRSWVDYLSDEDIAFVRRFVLASGSLKQVAQKYGVTYPTIRLRLDRLIAKIEVVEEQSEISEFERLLRGQFADGKVDHETFKLLLAAHLKDQERSHATPPSDE